MLTNTTLMNARTHSAGYTGRENTHSSQLTSRARPKRPGLPASPRQRAHTMLDLPVPLGPRTTFSPGDGRTVTSSKVLHWKVCTWFSVCDMTHWTLALNTNTANSPPKGQCIWKPSRQFGLSRSAYVKVNCLICAWSMLNETLSLTSNGTFQTTDIIAALPHVCALGNC